MNNNCSRVLGGVILLFLCGFPLLCANEMPVKNTVFPLVKSLQIPVDSFILFQIGDTYGAFRLTVPLEKHQGWKYEWIINPDEEGCFSGSQVKKGEGEVFKKSKTSFFKKKNKLENGQKSRPSIKIDNVIQFGWSEVSWIYPPETDGKVHIVITETQDIDKLNISIF